MATTTLELKGGNGLKKALADIAGRLGSGGQVKVGFLADATYPAEEGKEPINVAQVAFWQEFGTDKIPPRPFFRSVIENQGKKWGKALALNAKATNYDTEKTLARMGEGIKGQVQHSINEWSSPPNAPYTVAKKGFNKPLIDTTHMLRSVDYQVLDGNEP